jgi:hypothetical protein
LQAAEDARDVADVAEQVAQRAEPGRLREQFADEGLAAVDLGQVERGAASQRSSSRAPADVVVRLIAPRSEPSRAPRLEVKISRLRRVAGSSRSVPVLRYSCRLRRFSGLAQRFSVA